MSLKNISRLRVHFCYSSRERVTICHCVGMVGTSSRDREACCFSWRGSNWAVGLGLPNGVGGVGSCPTMSEPFCPLPLLMESALGEARSQGRSSEADATMKGQVEMLGLPVFDLEPVGGCGSACTLFVLP